MCGLNGRLFLIVYLAVIAIAIVALYALIRLAVRHALKAHAKWIDQGKLEGLKTATVSS